MEGKVLIADKCMWMKEMWMKDRMVNIKSEWVSVNECERARARA